MIEKQYYIVIKYLDILYYHPKLAIGVNYEKPFGELIKIKYSRYYTNENYKFSMNEGDWFDNNSLKMYNKEYGVKLFKINKKQLEFWQNRLPKHSKKTIFHDIWNILKYRKK